MERIFPVIVLVGVVALAMAGMLLALNPGNPDEKELTAPKDIPVATIFYQWFGYAHGGNEWPCEGGLGTFHWNDILDNQLITGFVVNRPEIDHYCSDADETISWQLQKM